MLRSKIEILADVLEAAARGATKTRILSKANLNQKLADQTIRLLDDLKLLTEKKGKSVSYFTTKRGLHFLEEYRRLQKALKE
jgi:predicted transcriptional regulator